MDNSKKERKVNRKERNKDKLLQRAGKVVLKKILGIRLVSFPALLFVMTILASAPLAQDSVITRTSSTGSVTINDTSYSIAGSSMEVWHIPDPVGSPWRGPVTASGNLLVKTDDMPEFIPLPDWFRFPNLFLKAQLTGYIEVVILRGPGDGASMDINLGVYGQLHDEMMLVDISDTIIASHAFSGWENIHFDAGLPVEMQNQVMTWTGDAMSGTVTGYGTICGHVARSVVELPVSYSGSFQASNPAVPLPARFRGSFSITHYNNQTGDWMGEGYRQYVFQPPAIDCPPGPLDAPPGETVSFTVTATHPDGFDINPLINVWTDAGCGSIGYTGTNPWQITFTTAGCVEGTYNVSVEVCDEFAICDTCVTQVSLRSVSAAYSMTQWGLILLILAVAGFFGYVILRRRRVGTAS